MSFAPRSEDSREPKKVDQIDPAVFEQVESNVKPGFQCRFSELLDKQQEIRKADDGIPVEVGRFGQSPGKFGRFRDAREAADPMA